MALTLEQWHRRYQQQARWTRDLRRYIYDRAGLRLATRILDVGCGTGVILKELGNLSPADFYGLDISLPPLLRANATLLSSLLTQADALYLPYSSASFDITMCHFVLLWITNPWQAILEMARVTRRDGFVCALAEPDYGGRIDYPEQLSQIGMWQTEALKEQGANPCIGRELRSLFSSAGLQNVEVGVLGGQWREYPSGDDFELEWEVIQSDLQGRPEFSQSVDQFKSLEIGAREKHQRILYVPTFYAFGQVQG